MQGALVPAVVALLVHVDNVANAQLELVLAVGRVRSDAPEPTNKNTRDNNKELETKTKSAHLNIKF